MLHKTLIKKINFEIEEIEKLLSSYRLIIDLCKIKKPDLMEMTIASTVLHSFYNGIENIIVAIGKDIDGEIPTAYEWHRKFLKEMSKMTEKRKAVFSLDTIKILLEYLGFRHFFRHSYSFHLNWDKLRGLIVPIDDVWNNFKNELLVFVDWLKSQ